jgi:hypothetical protein
MKTMYVVLISVLLSIPQLSKAQTTEINLTVLVGKWKLDMSPQDQTDSNFAMMEISEIKDNSFKGVFYREGVEIKDAQINTQLGVIYGALISGDNSGDYNSSFYLIDGILHGTTHAVNRNFLSVWTGTKED